MVKALDLLEKKNVNFVARIYGNTTDRDVDYYKKVRRLAVDSEKKGKVVFNKGVPNYEAPSIYTAHDIFINATPKGSFDKSILEAMACGTIPLVCNESFREILPPELLFKEGDVHDLSFALELLMSLRQEQRDKIGEQLRETVVQEHSLARLMDGIFETIT